jgi:hypothetical protein
MTKKRGIKIGLKPHPKTNPERLPIPRSADLEFFQEQDVFAPELCYITSLAVGHKVAVYWAGRDPASTEATIALLGSPGPAYQVMRWDERPGPGYSFWVSHDCGRPQWYSTPEEACAAYVASYRQWIKDHPDNP